MSTTTRSATKTATARNSTPATRRPSLRDVADLMADALAADAALTPEQRAMFNAIHDALSTGVALAAGSVSEQATRNVRDAGDRAHSAACAVVVANRRAAR